MTIKQTIITIRSISVPAGYRLTCSWSSEWKEYTVRTWRGIDEIGSYFTNDGQDAVFTAQAIARELVILPVNYIGSL